MIDSHLEEMIELAISGSGDYDQEETDTFFLDPDDEDFCIPSFPDEEDEDEWRLRRLGSLFPSSFMLRQAIECGRLEKLFPDTWPMMYHDLILATEACREAFELDWLCQAISTWYDGWPQQTPTDGHKSVWLGQAEKVCLWSDCRVLIIHLDEY